MAKAHENILTAAEKAFLSLSTTARADLIKTVGPTLRAGIKTLTTLGDKHPEIARAIKDMWPTLLSAVMAGLTTGKGFAGIIDGITARAPDLAPNLFRAIKDA